MSAPAHQSRQSSCDDTKHGKLDAPLLPQLNELESGQSDVALKGEHKLVVKTVAIVMFLLAAASLIVFACSRNTSNQRMLRISATLASSPMPTQSGNESLASASSCERRTGGSCFLQECNPRRGSVECHASNIGWRECLCPSSQCAHFDGKCYDTPEPRVRSFGTWLRYESELSLLFFVVPLGRSGLLSKMFSCFGVDRIASARTTIRTNFDFTKSLTELSIEQEFETPLQIFGVIASKLAVYHCGQVLFVVAGFFAYKVYMGPWQIFFGTIAILKEAWYLSLIVWATCCNRGFLMFCPASERRSQLTYAYFFDPDYFLACCVSGDDNSLARNTNIRTLSFVVSFIGGCAAMLAMLVGLVGDGAMFPSLFVGYLYSGLSVLVLPVSMMTFASKAPQKTRAEMVEEAADLDLKFRIEQKALMLLAQEVAEKRYETGAVALRGHDS
eukprot:TRINITY_DN54213_c0_g1_i1.p1 TRINITY_DN54213_c0_g1~~TRINITY_DN54213_c0_g1_i1.p1  ORF type:complete len:458 (-),score=45.72 TRINITY_DN54213_c0_g1_i1:134-1465(-)